jgi:hypothetical protein
MPIEICGMTICSMAMECKGKSGEVCQVVFQNCEAGHVVAHRDGRSDGRAGAGRG